jgi:tetratricopeptide (TPR) repeat protein
MVMMLASGQELCARFVLVRPLGRGGHGEVWLARDRDSGTHVAVQVLASDLVASPELMAGIEAACERMRRIEHPHLLRLIGFFRTANLACVAAEYAPLGDLSSWRGRRPVEIARPAIEVARALACLHANGLVHRDVKTGNVLIGADGGAKLGDFLASLPVGTNAGALVSRGSPYSASPQQLAGAPAMIADDIYAFGVLLYELLSGYPPFYPEITQQRVTGEVPPPPTGKHPVPQSLRDMVLRCLAKDPDDRPRDLNGVASELAEIEQALRAPAADDTRRAPQLAPPVEHGAPIRPQWQRPAVDASPASDRQLRGEGFRRGLLAAAAAVLLIAAVGVFLVLPRWVAERRPVEPAAVLAPAPAVPAPVQEEQVDYATLAEQQREAEELRASLDARVTALAGRGVEKWGDPDFNRARELIDAGDSSFAERKYAQALQAFGSARDLVDALETRAPDALAAALKSGDQALDAGRSDAAASAFALALEIDPGNQRATRGVKRASTLDQVLGLITQAEDAERDGDLPAARDAFAKAAELDDAMQRASNGRARVVAALADAEYRETLARGFAAQASGDRAGARKAFEAAKRMRPQAAEPARALAQLAEEGRTEQIETLLGRARELEADERWQQALATYRDVLAIDSTVEFAQQGVARTEPRVALNDELELYITQPERLFSAPVRSSAAAALERARRIESPGPRLTRQITTLDGWLQRAGTPVEVALVSDNATRVTIYKVGELGTFATRSLELMPGKYTVVGTRPGYRDVRRQFDVLPGSERPTLEIRCEERI